MNNLNEENIRLPRLTPKNLSREKPDPRKPFFGLHEGWNSKRKQG